MTLQVLPSNCGPRAIVRVSNGVSQHRTDTLATELPVALEYNGISHAVLLASPGDIDDLVLGFSCTEGILDHPDQLYELEVEVTEQGLIAHARIAAEQLHRLKQRRRQLAGRTGCGLCGLENLADVKRELPPLATPDTRLAAKAISQAARHLLDCQPLRAETGATHAAAWANMQGQLILVREDIGRHNALDKLAGSLLRQYKTTPAGFCVVSSRASFEMVQKAASMGTTALVALSAATTLAIDAAEQLGVMLAGFARADQFTVYTHANYLANGGLHE